MKQISRMYDPPHPGAFIREVYLKPFSMSGRQLAKKLDVSSSTMYRLLRENSSLSPGMALRLSKALGRSPESWLAMQDHYDLARIGQKVDLGNVGKADFDI